MSNLFIFGDNASSTMASSITNAQTTVTVQAGNGAFFPAPSAGHQLAVTFEDTAGNLEVAYCTGITGDVLTVVRGAETIPSQGGGPALAFASGSRVEARVTAGMLNALLQKNGGDTLAGTTNLTGVLALGGGGSVQGGEFTGAHRGAPGVTGNQILVPPNGTSPATMAGSNILTTADLVANLPAGFGLMSAGMICLWYGSTGSIPSGWSPCDGGTYNTFVTPDLRNRFVVGAGATYAQGSTGGSGGTTTSSVDPLTAGGAYAIAGHTLTVAEMPAHAHNIYSSSQFSGNSFSFVNYAGATGGAFTNTNPGAGGALIQNTGGGGSHTHGSTGNLAHTHTYTLPPYYALVYIMRTS
jgi:hypothetical protein